MKSILSAVAALFALCGSITHAKRVHIAASRATLLSGGFMECLYVGDPTCSGGIATVDAYIRYWSKASAEDERERESFLVIPFLDTTSPFANMYEGGLEINILFYGWLMTWYVHFGPTELLFESLGFEAATLTGATDLQWERFPLVYTNVAVPPSNIWHEYVNSVHFDVDLGLAVLYVASPDPAIGRDAAESAIGSLTYVARVNANNNCGSGEANVFIRERDSLPTYDGAGDEDFQFAEYTECYIPVIFFNDDKNMGIFTSFLEQVTQSDFPPALIMDLNGDAPEYKEPTRVGPDLYTWVVSYSLTKDNFYDQVLTTSNETLDILNIELLFADMTVILPEKMADDEYKLGIDYFSWFANDTYATDNPVGKTGKFPPVVSDTGLNRCYAGECEIGNMYTDALKWHMKSDIAFLPSILFKGDGWDAGMAMESYLYESLPQTNYVCNGTMNGVSVFQLMKYSINKASFDGKVTMSGGELLQVSGMRVTYNTQLPDNKLVAIDVYDKELMTYKPLDPTALYTFATDSFVCKLYADFPTYTTKLKATGERSGEYSIETNQLVAEMYLSLLKKPYQPIIEGRLRSETGRISESFNLVSTKADCVNTVTYWEPDYSACLVCPSYANVNWYNDTLEVAGQSGSRNVSTGYGYLINNEAYPVKVTPKAKSFFDYVEYSLTANGENVDNQSIILQPGNNLTVEFMVVPALLDEGVLLSYPMFGIASGGNQPGCIGNGIVLNLRVLVTPKLNMNQIGKKRYIGFVLFFAAFAAAIGFGVWVYCHSKLRVVMAMQPIFLYAICLGIAILSVTIIFLSIDDSLNLSTENCNRKCMATYWFLSLGFCISVSALFSKLWRINKLFSQQQFRRVQIRERDVIMPFAVLFTLNFLFLLTWTIADPLEWVRVTVKDEPWNMYGRCESPGTVGRYMMILIGIVNGIALAITCWQAYLARNINSDFSEAKYLGIGLFSWAQVAIVGVPVFFLIDKTNPTARAFLLSALIFVVSMSMMIIIFVPMMLTAGQAKDLSVRVSGFGGSSGKSDSGTGSTASHSFRGRDNNVRISGLDTGSGSSKYSSHGQYKSAVSTTSHFDSIQEVPEAPESHYLDDDVDATNNDEECPVKVDDEANGSREAADTDDACLESGKVVASDENSSKSSINFF